MARTSWYRIPRGRYRYLSVVIRTSSCGVCGVTAGRLNLQLAHAFSIDPRLRPCLQRIQFNPYSLNSSSLNAPIIVSPTLTMASSLPQPWSWNLESMRSFNVRSRTEASSIAYTPWSSVLSFEWVFLSTKASRKVVLSAGGNDHDVPFDVMMVRGASGASEFLYNLGATADVAMASYVICTCRKGAGRAMGSARPRASSVFCRLAWEKRKREGTVAERFSYPYYRM